MHPPSQHDNISGHPKVYLTILVSSLQNSNFPVHLLPCYPRSSLPGGISKTFVEYHTYNRKLNIREKFVYLSSPHPVAAFFLTSLRLKAGTSRLRTSTKYFSKSDFKGRCSLCGSWTSCCWIFLPKSILDCEVSSSDVWSDWLSLYTQRHIGLPRADQTG